MKASQDSVSFSLKLELSLLFVIRLKNGLLVYIFIIFLLIYLHYLFFLLFTTTTDNCVKCGVVFTDLISTVEFINCQSIKAQVCFSPCFMWLYYISLLYTKKCVQNKQISNVFIKKRYPPLLWHFFACFN